MKYHFVKPSQSNKKKRIVLVVIFLGIVFFWPYIKRGTFFVFEPVIVRVFEVSGGVLVVPDFVKTFFTSHRQSQQTIETLSQRIEELENKNQEYESLLREVLPINDMGTTTIFDRKKTIILNSLAQDYSRLYATVLFNKGFKDGVKEGDYVFLRGRNIMCSITEVYAQSSACSLFTAYGRSIEGVTASSSVVLTLTGRGGHYLASVVRDTPVIVGEKVYFKENQSFVLGKVVDIINNNQDTSWHVFIEAEYNPSVSSIFYIEPDLQLQ